MSNVADQCRALGLKVGDTIEGREEGSTWWNETRLTLLWLGEEKAAWREISRTRKEPQWSAPKEAVNWTLSARQWKKVQP